MLRSYREEGWGDPLWVKRKLAERKLFIQDALRVQARTSVDEVEMVAKTVAEKLNRHKSPRKVEFLIPSLGFSSISTAGKPLYDPEVDAAFTVTLKKHLRPEIEVIEVNTHIKRP